MKTTWQRIANRLRGFGLPFIGGGLSWEPPPLWANVAQEVISYLEDRRVLYNVSALESPDHCIESVIKIREYLTEQISRLENKPGLPAHLRYMRGACREFLNATQQIERGYGRLEMRGDSLSGREFWVALGQLRATFGTHLGIIAAAYKLGMEGDLATILPKPEEN